MAPPARVIEEEYENISQQLNDDESIADDVTVASASFMVDEDRYDVSQASTGHRKRKRDENAHYQAQQNYADELLDYFMTASLDTPAQRPEPPLNFQPDHIIDQDEHTAMHWAAAMGDIEVIRQLKKFNGNIFAQNKRGETPLMRAVMFTNCKDKQTMPQVVKELINSIEAVDKFESNILHHAASTTQVTKQKTARYYLDVILNKMQELFDPSHVQKILDAQDKEGNTPIHIAAHHCARKSIRALMGRGARTDIQNKLGFTAEQLIQEVNHKTMRERHQGSSSPYAPDNSYGLIGQDPVENTWEGYDTPPRYIRRSTAPAHYSEAAMSVEKKLLPLMQEKLGGLANSFDEELREKDTSEQEANRIVATVQAELGEIRGRILEVTAASDDADTKAELARNLSHVEQEIVSLIEQQQQLQLLSRTSHEESKSNGHFDGEDDLGEKIMLAKLLCEEQERRHTLVGRYKDALGAAGDVGEMGELYRRVIAKSVGIGQESIDGEIDVLLEAMQEEERDSLVAGEGVDGLMA